MAKGLQKLSRRVLHILSTRFRWVSIAVISVIVALGYVLFLSPKLAEVNQVGVFDLARTKDRLLIKQETLTATQRLATIYDQLQLEDVTSLSEILPRSQDIPNMFVEVEAIAARSGLQLDNVGFTDLSVTTKTTTPTTADDDTATGAAAPTPTTPTSAAGKASIKKMKVSFSVSGGAGYDDLKTFMTNVESNIRLLDVQSFAYTPSTEKEKYQIEAITYYLAQ